MNKGGRPRLLDDAVLRAQLCAVISVGCGREVAARYLGISPDTVRRAIRRDRKFADQLAQAESKHEVTQLMHINQAARNYWRAAAWKLERKYPDQYQPRRARMVTHEEVEEMLTEFAKIVSRVLPDAAANLRIADDLERLLKRIDPPRARFRSTSPEIPPPEPIGDS